jgi:hypothetical protein
MPRLRFALATLAFFFLSASLGAQRTVFFYEETFGGHSWIGRYQADRSIAGTKLMYESPAESHRISLDPDLSGQDWEWESVDGKNRARAERRGETVFLEGSLDGSPRRAEKKMSRLPWYQAPDYSLSLLAEKPTGARQEFWMILPNDFSFYRMSARNAGADAFDRGGKEVAATKIVLSVSGVPEFVWKNEYWYSLDGDYLGFHGRRGNPLSPIGKLTLLSKEALP